MQSTYLVNRNGNYYLRFRVPTDLLHVIPQRELKKSLKTTNFKTARVSSFAYISGITQTFSLLRSSFISPVEAQGRLDSILNRQVKEEVKEKPKEVLMLSAVIKQFLDDRKESISQKTRLDYEVSYKLILDVMGDRDIHSIDRRTVRTLRDLLALLPSNLYKKYPHRTAKEVLESIGEGTFKVDSIMSSSNVNKLIARFSFIMHHCVKEDYIKVNPASGLKIKLNIRTEDERKAYDVADLKRITDNLPQDVDKPERHWIPLISMYTGMRLDEVCQLYTDDVKEIEGVMCFDINDDKDKKLKTLSSMRIVPVHPELIALGFLEYVKGCKERLWMNLTRRDADGYGNAFGKWFQRFNREHVTDDKKKCYHSLRHTFTDHLKQLGVQEGLIAELVGHSSDSISMSRYGKRYQPKVLLEVVKKVDYGF